VIGSTPAGAQLANYVRDASSENAVITVAKPLTGFHLGRRLRWEPEFPRQLRRRRPAALELRVQREVEQERDEPAGERERHHPPRREDVPDQEQRDHVDGHPAGDGHLAGDVDYAARANLQDITDPLAPATIVAT
jgi:hypothetical protein